MSLGAVCCTDSARQLQRDVRARTKFYVRMAQRPIAHLPVATVVHQERLTASTGFVVCLIKREELSRASTAAGRVRLEDKQASPERRLGWERFLLRAGRRPLRSRKGETRRPPRGLRCAIREGVNGERKSVYRRAAHVLTNRVGGRQSRGRLTESGRTFDGRRRRRSEESGVSAWPVSLAPFP